MSQEPEVRREHCTLTPGGDEQGEQSRLNLLLHEQQQKTEMLFMENNFNSLTGLTDWKKIGVFMSHQCEAKKEGFEHTMANREQN